MLLVARHAHESMDCFSLSFYVYLIMFNHPCNRTKHFPYPLAESGFYAAGVTLDLRNRALIPKARLPNFDLSLFPKRMECVFPTRHLCQRTESAVCTFLQVTL
jgi:hypothetical protein